MTSLCCTNCSCEMSCCCCICNCCRAWEALVLSDCIRWVCCTKLACTSYVCIKFIIKIIFMVNIICSIHCQSANIYGVCQYTTNYILNKSEYGQGSICKFCLTLKLKSNQHFFLVLVQSWSGLGLVKISSAQHKYKLRLCFKSNHKVPVQVQVKPIFFSGFGLLLVLFGSGKNFKSLAQVLSLCQVRFEVEP